MLHKLSKTCHLVRDILKSTLVRKRDWESCQSVHRCGCKHDYLELIALM